VLSLYHKNCVVTTRLLIKHLPSILDNSYHITSQPEGEPTYLPKRTPENSGIYWDSSAERIGNLVKASSPPYPTAFTFLESIRVDILNGHPFDSRIAYNARPGEIIDFFPGGHFLVMAGDAAFYVRDYVCAKPLLIQKGMCFQLHSGSQLPDPHI
jgi:methionyl-tRNA formyltransferase